MLKKKINFIELFKKISNFKETRKELFKEDFYKNMKTICFDIENVFIRKVNLQESEELNLLSQTEEHELRYILIKHEILESDSDALDREQEEMKGLKKLEINKLKIQQLIRNYGEKSEFEESKGNCCTLGDQGKLCLCNHSLY